MPDSDLIAVVRELCVAVNGINWDATRVQQCVDRMLALARKAPSDDRDEALTLIAERLARSSVDDADGVAHVAISGGTLIEMGASPRPLSAVLHERLPSVLQAARRFANACIADLQSTEDPWETVDESKVLTEVDGLPITLPTLRKHIASDRPGGAALARLSEWTLPTVAALSRDRSSLTKAIENSSLVRSVAELRNSDAWWLHPLLATQLDAPWRLALVEQRRVFDLRMDEISSNFDLHTLVEKAIGRAGVPLRDQPNDGSVHATFELLTAHARLHGNHARPAEHVVWREGVPTDVPAFRGVRTLVAVNPTISRTWRANSPFVAMTPRVTVEREWSASETSDFLQALGQPAL